MQFKYLILFFILGYMATNTLIAQQKWGLNQCILYAIDNNTDLKQYKIQENIYAETLNQSKRNLLPGVSASSGAGLYFGRSVDPNTNDIITTEYFSNSYSISSSVTVFKGFRLQNNIQYEKFRKKASEYNRLNAIDDLAFSVMNAYFDVIYYKGLLKIAEDQLETSNLKLKATEKQVEVGLMAKSDLLEMRANREKEELNRIQIENNLRSSELSLRQNMNMVGDQRLVLEEEIYPFFKREIPSANQLFNPFARWSPYYQSLVSQLKISEKSLAVTRSGLYPSLSFWGEIGTGYYETNKDENDKVIGFEDQFKNNKSKYLGASLSIPIFSQWSSRSNVKQAKLEVEMAKAKLESEKQKLYFDMSQNLNDLEALEREYLQYEKQKEVDQLAYQTAEKKLEQGLINVIDFYVIKNRYANSQSQVLRAKLQLEIKKRTLDFYMGKRFWE